MSDCNDKFIPITCERPTQPDARFNVSSLSPTYRSTLMVNSLEPDKTGISQQTRSRLSTQSAMQRQFPCAWVFLGGCRYPITSNSARWRHCAIVRTGQASMRGTLS